MACSVGQSVLLDTQRTCCALLGCSKLGVTRAGTGLLGKDVVYVCVFLYEIVIRAIDSADKSIHLDEVVCGAVTLSRWPSELER